MDDRDFKRQRLDIKMIERPLALDSRITPGNATSHLTLIALPQRYLFHLQSLPDFGCIPRSSDRAALSMVM